MALPLMLRMLARQVAQVEILLLTGLRRLIIINIK